MRPRNRRPPAPRHLRAAAGRGRCRVPPTARPGPQAIASTAQHRTPPRARAARPAGPRAPTTPPQPRPAPPAPTRTQRPRPPTRLRSQLRPLRRPNRLRERPRRPGTRRALPGRHPPPPPSRPATQRPPHAHPAASPQPPPLPAPAPAPASVPQPLCHRSSTLMVGSMTQRRIGARPRIRCLRMSDVGESSDRGGGRTMCGILSGRYGPVVSQTEQARAFDVVPTGHTIHRPRNRGR